MRSVIVHLVVVIVLLSSFILTLTGIMRSSLAVVISVLSIATVFWSISAESGSSAGIAESWLAIGLVAGSYCFRAPH